MSDPRARYNKLSQPFKNTLFESDIKSKIRLLERVVKYINSLILELKEGLKLKK